MTLGLAAAGGKTREPRRSHDRARSGRRIAGVVVAAAVVVGIVLLQLGQQRSVPSIVQATIDGARLGAVLALIGVGLSLVYAVTGVFNFAHGEFASLGALLAWGLNAGAGIPLILAAALALPAAAAVAYGNERIVWRPLRRRGVDATSALVVAIGLGLAGRSTFLVLAGGGRLSYSDYAVQPPLVFAGVSVTPKDLIALAIALAALAGLGLFLARTRFGQAIRAVSDDQVLAGATGISAHRVTAVVWVIAGALAGLGGVLLGISQQVTWDMGNQVLLLVIAGVTLGGLGTVTGAVLGSVIVGVSTQLSALWLPADLKLVAALVTLTLILLLRPQGLLGRSVRAG